MPSTICAEFDDEESAKNALRSQQVLAEEGTYRIEKVGKTRSARACSGVKWIVRRQSLSPIKKKRRAPEVPFKSLRKIPTVGDLREFLRKLSDDAASNAMPLVYSQDDEGNHFQTAFNAPTIAYVEPQESPYHLRVVGDDAEDAIPVVLIN